jgi:hypothetical protein
VVDQVRAVTPAAAIVARLAAEAEARLSHKTERHFLLR